MNPSPTPGSQDWRQAPQLLTLGEGNTPLVRSRRLGPSEGLPNLYFKLETTNPTGSFKDRFAVAAVRDMLATGRKLCLATSSGNTGASLAAYCAAAGLPCHVAIVEEAPRGKLRQMLAYGAHLYQIRKFGYEPKVTREVMDLLQRMAAECSGAVQISAFRYSPAGMVGVRALAYELAQQLPGGIDHVFSPAGGGGLVVAVGEGFEELKQQGKLKRGPAIECVQPEGNDTTAGPLRQGLERARPVNSTTTISGLQVAVVNDGDEAIQVCRASHGTGHLVSDEAVYEAQARLAREEGIFSEPAGATALAGALLAAKNGDVDRNATIVCLVTGIGFKDEHSLDGMTKDSPCPMLDTPKDLEDAILASEAAHAARFPQH